jgi:hypothetical protein
MSIKKSSCDHLLKIIPGLESHYLYCCAIEAHAFRLHILIR